MSNQINGDLKLEAQIETLPEAKFAAQHNLSRLKNCIFNRKFILTSPIRPF